MSQDVEINLKLLNLGTVGCTIKAMQETSVSETQESFLCRPGIYAEQQPHVRLSFNNNFLAVFQQLSFLSVPDEFRK